MRLGAPQHQRLLIKKKVMHTELCIPVAHGRLCTTVLDVLGYCNPMTMSSQVEKNMRRL